MNLFDQLIKRTASQESFNCESEYSDHIIYLFFYLILNNSHCMFTTKVKLFLTVKYYLIQQSSFLKCVFNSLSVKRKTDSKH